MTGGFLRLGITAKSLYLLGFSSIDTALVPRYNYYIIINKTNMKIYSNNFWRKENINKSLFVAVFICAALWIYNIHLIADFISK